MFKKVILLIGLVVISLELILHIFFLVQRHQPVQQDLTKMYTKIKDSDPSRTIYCIGDEYTADFEGFSNYPSYLQSLIQLDLKFTGQKVLNLGIKDSTIEDQLKLIKKIRPGSKVILRGNLSHLKFSKTFEKSYIESLQIVKWSRELISKPSSSVKMIERYYYGLTLKLIALKQHRVIYFNYPQADSFMSRFYTNSFYTGRSMKVPTPGYNYSQVDKKFLSHLIHPLSQEGAEREAELLFDYLRLHTKFLL